MAVVRSLLNSGVANASAVESFDLAFAVDNAAGAQLDILGDLVGIKRLLSYEPSVGSREMDDDEYRLCIRMAIAKNEWDGTNKGVFSAYDILAESGVGINYFDNQDNTITLNVTENLSVRMFEILSNIGVLLAPAGVGVEFEFSGSDITVNSYVAAGVSGIEQVIDVRAVGGDD